MSAGTDATSGLESLHGKVALVTGASSGIGEAIAEALAREGVRVTVAARRMERLHALTERLAPAETLAVQCDVRHEEQVENAVARTLERWGQLDLLIANAGFGYRKPTLESDTAIWKAMIDTNVYGLLLTLKHGVPPMVERGSGHVVVMSSIAGVVTTPGGGAYCGSKAAASAITDALRMEVGPQGISVTAIEPGVVISEFQQVAGYAPEIVPNMLKGATPLYPPDVARAVIFACQQPANTGVSELIIRPRGQAYP
jgi:3-hydroxy acid dehydrogenase / malonic semialdehyde reductase